MGAGRENGNERTGSWQIKRFDPRTGNGFIERQGGPDIFVHAGAVQSEGTQALRPGQAVVFEIEQGPKGPRDVNVVLQGNTSG